MRYLTLTLGQVKENLKSCKKIKIQPRGFVRPQAHGIHPPRKLLFFSEKLEKLIWKVWRKGPFSRDREKKREKISKEIEDGNERTSLAVRERSSGEEKRFEDYEPTRLIYKWWLVNERRRWERAEEYFRGMLEYERAGESGCNAKYGTKILEKI